MKYQFSLFIVIILSIFFTACDSSQKEYDIDIPGKKIENEVEVQFEKFNDEWDQIHDQLQEIEDAIEEDFQSLKNNVDESIYQKESLLDRKKENLDNLKTRLKKEFKKGENVVEDKWENFKSDAKDFFNEVEGK